MVNKANANQTVRFLHSSAQQATSTKGEGYRCFWGEFSNDQQTSPKVQSRCCFSFTETIRTTGRCHAPCSCPFCLVRWCLPGFFPWSFLSNSPLTTARTLFGHRGFQDFQFDRLAAFLKSGKLDWKTQNFPNKIKRARKSLRDKKRKNFLQELSSCHVQTNWDAN